MVFKYSDKKMEARDLIDVQKSFTSNIWQIFVDYQSETTNSLTARICGLRSVISEILLPTYSLIILILEVRNLLVHKQMEAVYP